MRRVSAKAHANIALVKYWGKKDEDLILPYNNSLSLTLDAFYTITRVSQAKEDCFILNGQVQTGEIYSDMIDYIDLFRKRSKIKDAILIESKNYFPTAAGLASSASGFAALATALNAYFELNMKQKEISILARRGSGSASRSIYGGLVEWLQGDDDLSSYAVKVDPANFDIGMLAVIIDDKEKMIKSRAGMKQTVATSPYYSVWVETAQQDIEAIKKAIKNQNVHAIGRIAEHSALKMHASMLTTKPAIMYFQDLTMKVLHTVYALREEGVTAYFTMDAGPNVKIITTLEDKDKIIDKLSEFIDKDALIYSGVGPDAKLID